MAETKTACVLLIPLDVSGGIFLLHLQAISFLEGENLRCLQNFLQYLRKNLQALQIFVDADIGFCGSLCNFGNPSFVSLSFINEWK